MKKVLFVFITLIISILIIELVSIPIFYYLNNKTLSKKKVNSHFSQLSRLNKKLEVNPFDITQGLAQSDVLHPYFGFARDYDLKQINYNDDTLISINEYGFLGDFPKRKSNTFRVALFGGSVAEELFVYSKDILENKLQQSNVLKGRDVQVISVALGGMKQPQQLMALNYFLSMGENFDIVVNLDGFNEVALSYCENVLAGISPFYPRSYSAYTSKAFSENTLYILSELVSSRRKVVKYADFFSSPIVKHSHLALSLWILFNKSEHKRQLDLDEELRRVMVQKKKSEGLSAQEKGPNFNNDNVSNTINSIVDLWGRTSLLMDNLCLENGIKYVHFLQPNQHVKNSKILSDWEKKNTIAKEDHCYRAVVEQCYPILIKAGERLKNSRVDFHDLTKIFSEINSDIYRDNCCHYNQQGNEILANRIAETIINRLN